MEEGETVEVKVETKDEIGRLARSFNRMAAGIAEREKRITQLAFNDSLTGLPNRAFFRQHLDLELKQAERRGGRGLALLCVDLDNFKAVNDTLGHPVGDELLRAVAAPARRQCRRRDASPASAATSSPSSCRTATPHEAAGAVARPADRRARRAVRDRRPRARRRRQRRHRDGARRRRRRRHSAQACRPRALPGQGRGRRHLPLLRSRDERARAGAPPARKRPAAGDRPTASSSSISSPCSTSRPTGSARSRR